MLKLLTFPGVDDDGNVLVQAFNPFNGLEKTATVGLHPKIAAYADGIKSCADKIYVLVNAMGAGEFYGSNINGDYFEEKQLNPTQEDMIGGDLFGHKTFLTAGIYRHHQNKNKERSMGRVCCAVYNETMHRVELILEVDRAKAKEFGHGNLVDALDAGENPAVSMGCRVKYDVCSICGHKSKTRNDYCIHAKTMMNQIMPDGRKVFVYNPRPKFFDISFVLIPADRTGYTMLKVAKAHAATPSAFLAAEYDLRDRTLQQGLHQKLASKQKLSKIVKRIPAMSSGVMPKLTGAEPEFPRRVIRIMVRTPMRKLLTTTAASGMVLRPSEFQRIVLAKAGKPGLAARLHNEGKVFSPVDRVDRSIKLGMSMADLSPDLRDALIEYVPSRSAFSPALAERLHFEKTASATSDQQLIYVENDALLDTIAAAYNGYREQLLEKISSVVVNITERDITLLTSIDEFGLEDAFADEQIKTASKAGIALLGAIPLAYLYGAHVGRKRGRSGPGPIDRFVEKHPVLAASVFVGLTRIGVKLHKRGLLNKDLLRKIKV